MNFLEKLKKCELTKGRKLAITIVAAAVFVLTVLGIVGYYTKGASLTANTTSPEKTTAPATDASQTTTTTSKTVPSLTLEDYSGGFFTIKKPVGWKVTVGGSCSTFSFIIQNPSNPA